MDDCGLRIAENCDCELEAWSYEFQTAKNCRPRTTAFELGCELRTAERMLMSNHTFLTTLVVLRSS